MQTNIKFNKLSFLSPDIRECVEIVISEEIEGRTYYYPYRSYCLNSQSSKGEIEAFVAEHEKKAAEDFARAKKKLMEQKNEPASVICT